MNMEINVHFLYCQPLSFVLFQIHVSDSLLIDESVHDHDYQDYNDAGNAKTDPPADLSHNHDKSSSELD